MSRLVPVIIDSDGGCDDAAALWFALTDPRLDVLAVTAVWGNVGVQQAGANLRLVCEAAGHPEVPVAVGAAAASAPGPLKGLRRGFHGTDGLGGHAVPPKDGPVAEPAVDLLLRITSRPGDRHRPHRPAGRGRRWRPCLGHDRRRPALQLRRQPRPGCWFAPWLVGQVADAPRFRSEVRRMLA